MRYFKNLVFWKKLVLAGVAPLLIISVLIGTLSYTRTRQTIQDAGRNSLFDAVNRVDISLTVRVRQLNSALQTLAKSLYWQHEGGAGPSLDAERLETLYFGLTEPFSEVSSVAVLWREELAYGTGSTIDPAVIRRLFQETAARPGKVIWSDLSASVFSGQRDLSRPVIPLLLSLQDAAGDSVGLIMLELDPEIVGSTVLSKQRIFNHQSTFLLNSKGHCIYSDNAVPEKLQALILEQYQAGRRSFRVEYGGCAYICYAQYNALTSWVTFSLIQEEYLFPSSDSLRQYIALLVLVCGLAACGMLMVQAHIITQPLARLNDGMRQVQADNFNVYLDNDRTDEVGELTDSFNFMVARIRALIQQIYQEQQAQRSAELESLQAQINPHFLYNTLDSINWMLLERGEMDVSSIVVALGKLMQYSMDTSVTLVALKEEYRNARDFLLIQKNRLEDQLEYELVFEEGLEDFLVPKLTLQPLLENAIRHGVVRAGRRGTVSVHSGWEEGRVCITVRDDGVGMDGEQLAACRRLLENSQEGQRSIGLRNVARRLQLHFNGQCEFSVGSAPGNGTVFRLLLPAITEEERP